MDSEREIEIMRQIVVGLALVFMFTAFPLGPQRIYAISLSGTHECYVTKTVPVSPFANHLRDWMELNTVIDSGDRRIKGSRMKITQRVLRGCGRWGRKVGAEYGKSPSASSVNSTL